MKIIKITLIGILILLISSCAASIKFPISDIVPAADITASKKQDSNKNYDFKVTAKSLASPERIDPSACCYVVWGITENNLTKNLGQMLHKNAKKVELKTTTPFVIKEIFITAEKEGAITYPSGIEITRQKIGK